MPLLPKYFEKKIDRKSLSLLISLLVFIIIFVSVSQFAMKYSDEIRNIVQQKNGFGIFVYIFITALAVVIAPMSTLPLLPIASTLWGPIIASILSIIGWVGGAMVAFVIARKLGKPFVGKLVSFEKIEKVEKFIPQKRIFWTVVFLRMGIPVDVLSYALGLFSHMKISQYFFATLLGVSPFAFVFAYIGVFPIYFQLIALAVAISIMFFGLKLIKKI